MRSRWSRPSAMALAPAGACRTPPGRYKQRNLVSDSAWQGRAARPEPGQRVGAGLRAADPRMGGRQRHRRVHSLLRGSRSTPVPKARPNGLDPRRGADRRGLQPLDRIRRPLRRELGPALLPLRLRVGDDHRLEPERPAAGAVEAGGTVPPFRAPSSRGSRSPTRRRGPQIYATDFHNGKVDVWDANFAPVHRPRRLHRPGLPSGFAPFGIEAINGDIYVTYAKQDADAEDDVAGPGNGSSTSSTPTGTAAPLRCARPAELAVGHRAGPAAGFGSASGALLIGNFGDGRINAYDPVSGKSLGALRSNTASRSRSTGCGRWSSATG